MGKVVSSFLKDQLKKFVKPSGNAKVTFKHGILMLQNYEVRTEIMERIDLPLKFELMRIGKVKVKVPNLIELLKGKKPHLTQDLHLSQFVNWHFNFPIR